MAITANPNGSWSERNIAAITDCMDSAFATVLSDEFDRLTTSMSHNQIGAWLERSEQSIERLRNNGDMPDYSDRMVALRYVILYQLGHINLAYTVIKDGLHGQKLTDTGALQVVDFGAGTLAMSFGVALAVADALADGESIQTVRVDAIDTGGPMLDLGQKLWREFASEVTRRPEMAYLSQAAKLVQHSLHTNHRPVQKRSDSDCWVSALHTLYDNNERVVSSTLTTLYGSLDPGLMVLACVYGKVNIARQVLPSGRSWQRKDNPQLRFRGYMRSHASNIAFQRGFKRRTWNFPNLYTDCSDFVAFTSEARKEVHRRREQARLQQEQKRRQAEARRQSDRERQQRQLDEQAGQRQQVERWRRIQEEGQQRLEEERRRRQQGEAQRHSGPRQPSPEAERLREQQRRAEEIQRRDAQERARQRQQQEEARRHSDRVEHQGQQERWRKIQEEARQRLEQERQQRRQEGEAQRHSNRGIPSKIRSGLSLLFRRRRK